MKSKQSHFKLLYDFGFNLIPLLPRDKKPVGRWQEYQERCVSVKEVERWDRDPRGLNVGIVTGRMSGDLVVLDIDDIAARRDLESRFLLPVTPTVRTGNGWHLYFRDTTRSLRNFAGKITGVDLRGQGGYVVGAGSIHPSGRVYAWEPGLSPKAVTIAPVPQWLLDLARPASASDSMTLPHFPAGRRPTFRVTLYAQRALENASFHVETALPGTRNDTLNATAYSMGRFVAAGALDRDDVEQTLIYACHVNGLIRDDGERAVLLTLKSGLGAGLQKPKDLTHVLTRPTFESIRRRVHLG